MSTQGKCDVCGKFKELEPPREKFHNVSDDYLMLCLACRAKVNSIGKTGIHARHHSIRRGRLFNESKNHAKK